MSNTDLQTQETLKFILDLAEEEAIRAGEYTRLKEKKKFLLEYFGAKTTEDERK